MGEKERPVQTGTFAARTDDALNFIPARLILPCISLAALFVKGTSARRALTTGWAFRRAHASPNSAWSEAAFAGALVGFLWYNSFPAQIFMGDTGSLSIGGIIAVFALCIRKELLLPLLCGVFLVESFSVMMQVGYFKYTKRKYGEGQRLLLMAPVHHHFQKKGQFETKIVLRFWIISLLLAAITLVTLKIR